MKRMNPLFLLLAGGGLLGLVVWKKKQGGTGKPANSAKSIATGIPGNAQPGISSPASALTNWKTLAAGAVAAAGSSLLDKYAKTGLDAATGAMSPGTSAKAPALGDTADTKNVSSEQYTTGDFGDNGSTGNDAGGDTSTAGDGSDETGND